MNFLKKRLIINKISLIIHKVNYSKNLNSGIVKKNYNVFLKPF